MFICYSFNVTDFETVKNESVMLNRHFVSVFRFDEDQIAIAVLSSFVAT